MPNDLRVTYYRYAEGSTDSILGVEDPVLLRSRSRPSTAYGFSIGVLTSALV
jgi:hypothetical protein